MRVTMLTIALFLCVAAGCSKAQKAQPMVFEDVPESIRQTASETLPDVKFDQALRRADGGYEVRGKDKDGKVRDVEFAADGSVIEVE